MSLGGDFYALSDAQLEQILDGTIDFFDFYELPAIDGGAAALFTEGEDAWDVLRHFFEDIAVLGVHDTDLIPEAAFYSSAQQVQTIAAQLARFTRQDLDARFHEDSFQSGDYYHGECWLEEPDELFEVIEALIAFYQDCAAKGYALIYRIT
jgi:hypothetical protein